MSQAKTQRVIRGGFTVIRVSKPRAAVRVDEIKLTAEQRKRFTVQRMPTRKVGA